MVDFDGTITDVDGFEALVKHFKGDEVWSSSEADLAAGRESLRTALARQTGYVRGPFDDVYAVHVAAVGIDPTFADFIARCENAQIPVTVVSSGIGPLIERRLADAGLGRLRVVAPAVDVAEDAWRMRFRDDSPNGTDKIGLVRALQASGWHVAYAGDGQSDFDAAIAADARFAKRGRKLERHLAALRLPFVAFDRFEHIALPPARS